MTASQRTDQAAQLLCPAVCEAVQRMPERDKAAVQEIRLRAGQPLCVFCGQCVGYLTAEGTVSAEPLTGMPVSARDVAESFQRLCGYSVHSHEEEIAQGFVAAQGGHRAGLGGVGVCRGGAVSGLRDITSICLRVAREVPGAADELLARAGVAGGLLVAGAPGSGKTTLLRDLARQLSCRGTKVVVVDERYELSALWNGQVQNDLGPSCDVLAGVEKAAAMMMALRCLSPQVLVCDELGSMGEIAALGACLDGGVTVVSSIHAGSWQELARRPQFGPLRASGAFGQAALLCGPERPCGLREVRPLAQVT